MTGEDKPKRGWEHPFFKNSANRLEVISHRGGAREFPEETIYACEESLKLPVDVLEVDIRSTRDGELVLMHNSTVHKTTNGAGRVNEYSLKHLQKLDAGCRWTNDDGETFPHRRNPDENIDHRIPTLREVLEAVREKKPPIVIEIKQKKPCIVEPLVELIRYFEMTEKVLIASLSHSILRKFRRACPEVATSASGLELLKFVTLNALFPGLGKRPEYDAVQIGIRYLKIPIPFINKKTIRAARKLNLPIQAWTVNRLDDMERMIRLEVDGIITDYPSLLLKLLNRNPPS